MMTVQLVYCIVALTALAVQAAEYSSYNTNKQMCCNGTVVDVSDVYDYGCCGTSAYLYKEFLCCGQNVLVALPKGVSENYWEYSCCLDSETGVAVVYNSTVQHCCEGNVVDLVDGKWGTCCGKKYFDYNTHMCCNGEVVEDQDNVACCGTAGLYNYKSQVCCSTWVQEDGEYTSHYKLVDTASETTACCALEVYDWETHVCIKEEIVDKPPHIAEDVFANSCGDVPYDSSEQTCCTKWELVGDEYEETVAQLHDIAGNTTYCCNENVYDYGNEICCRDGRVLSIPADMKDEGYSLWCCGDEVLSYNDNTKTCRNNQVVDKNDDDDTNYSCGEDSYYNPETQTCCRGNVVDRYSDDGTTETDCCWDAKETYKVGTEFCCGESIVSKEELGADDEDNACCMPYYY